MGDISIATSADSAELQAIFTAFRFQSSKIGGAWLRGLGVPTRGATQCDKPADEMALRIGCLDEGRTPMRLTSGMGLKNWHWRASAHSAETKRRNLLILAPPRRCISIASSTRFHRETPGLIPGNGIAGDWLFGSGQFFLTAAHSEEYKNHYRGPFYAVVLG
jgi:hypothetical protein